MTAPRLNVHDLRSMLLVPVAMSVIMIGVSLAADEALLTPGFVALGAAAGLLHLALAPFVATGEWAPSTGETFATAALAWAIVGVLGAIPLYLGAFLIPQHPGVAVFSDPLNALFESVSGFTSTGLTMVEQPQTLPASLQFWRSFTEWIGGIGLALLMLAVMNAHRDGGDLFESELNKPAGEDRSRAATRTWIIYGVLSGASIGVFLALGMPVWEAVNHGLTAIATGGFTIVEGSFASYGAGIQWAAMLLMVAGAISFAAYRDALCARRPLAILRRGPVVLLLVGIAVAGSLVWLERGALGAERAAASAWFQVVSAFATAGFSTTSLSDWTPSSLAVLIACMLIGGASGATTGGVKTDRVLLIGRGVGWRFERLFRGAGDVPRTIDGQRYSADAARLQVESAATLVGLWLATAFAGCLLLMPAAGENRRFIEVLFETMSALGSVGLSVGITGPELPGTGKVTLMVLMWAGRLELVAALCLLALPLAHRRAAR